MTIIAQGAQPFIRWDWVLNNLDDIWDRTLQHLSFTLVAVGVGLVLSVFLSVVALRWRRLYAPIIGVSNILYTVPSLALFAFLVPFFGAGFLTAEIALVTYTILILVRNIVTGIDSVPAEVKEAAIGMGYTRRKTFVSVELPLALPVIFAGLRIATVTVVGLVTVTALLGLGGYGFFILDGFRRSIVFPTEIILGTVLSVALAAALDFGILGLQWLSTPWLRKAAP